MEGNLEAFEDLELFDEEEHPPFRPTWFDKMSGTLYWKVLPPDIHNPFRNPIPDRVLTGWLANIESLRSASGLRCMCDGYEVLIIKNLTQPIYCTDHPCIASMSPHDIQEYIERSGVERKIEEELKKTQRQIQELLVEREKEAAENPQRDLKPMGKKKKKVEKKKMPNGGRMARIIRR